MKLIFKMKIYLLNYIKKKPIYKDINFSYKANKDKIREKIKF